MRTKRKVRAGRVDCQARADEILAPCTPFLCRARERELMPSMRNAPPLLRVLRGPTLGQTFEIDRDEMTIGRDEACDIVLDTISVSRRHARLRRRTGTVFLEDLGSTGGTLVNG